VDVRHHVMVNMQPTGGVRREYARALKANTLSSIYSGHLRPKGMSKPGFSVFKEMFLETLIQLK
jgi:hypothetical protein